MRLSALVLLLGVLVATPALAADPPTDPAAAETLFEEGRKLLDAGKFNEACAKLEASNRAEPAVGTLLNLGDCNSARGKPASAWGNYRAAQSLALTRSDTKRADFAKKKADAIQPKLATLTISVVQPEPGLKVVRDGTEVNEGAWGTAIPADPGPHTVEATAPGKKPVTLTITIADGPSQNTLKVEPLVAGDSQGIAAVPPPENKGEKKDEVVKEPFLSTGKIVGFSAIGVGAIAIGVGTVFAISAKNQWNSASNRCDSNAACDETGLQINQDARSKGNLATVFLVSGLVVAAAGAACILFWPKPAPPQKAATLQWNASGFTF